MGWLKKYPDGGTVKKAPLKFLNTDDKKLPSAARIPEALIHTELSRSVGGEDGEPAYLVPSFKNGKFVKDIYEEFDKTGEYTGGPFKTWKEADDWDNNVRHPYIEHHLPIPMQFLNYGQKYGGGGKVDNTFIKKPVIREKIDFPRKEFSFNQDRIPSDIHEKINKNVEFQNKFNSFMSNADVTTDIMQLGHFIPIPLFQGIALAGDALGAPIDIAQAHDSYKKGNYIDAGANIAAAIVPNQLGKKVYKRDMYNTIPNTFENDLANLGDRNGEYIPLISKPSLRTNPVIKDAINKNRAYGSAISTETIYDGPYTRFPNSQLSKGNTGKAWLTGNLEKDAPLTKEQEILKGLGLKYTNGGKTKGCLSKY